MSVSAGGSHRRCYLMPVLGHSLKTSKQKILFLLLSAESQSRLICCEAPSDLFRNVDRLPSVHSPQVQVHPWVAPWLQHSPHPEAVSPSHGNALTLLPGNEPWATGRGKRQKQRAMAGLEKQRLLTTAANSSPPASCPPGSRQRLTRRTPVLSEPTCQAPHCPCSSVLTVPLYGRHLMRIHS